MSQVYVIVYDKKEKKNNEHKHEMNEDKVVFLFEFSQEWW
jgi:hypothetical protein